MPPRACCRPLNLSDAQLDQLRELGECLNYNGYGDSLADLHFHPAELYRALHPTATRSPSCANRRHSTP
jgi:hypothetical protein